MESEFVGYGTGEEDSIVVDDGGLGQMSERVQAMAQSLYTELETLVHTYGPDSAQSITPMLGALSSL
jgi:hypothetical protein